jgi:hypothetical protein
LTHFSSFLNFIIKVKRNKELIATNIQEIFNPFQIAQVFQPVDLNKLFSQQNLPAMISPIHVIQHAPPSSSPPPLINNEIGSVNPALLNGSSTIVTSTNINVTYLSGSIPTANKTYDVEKFKMHQGFIAVLKVRNSNE